MYLKKLEIKGFKSFADKTNVEFKDGITCIVGPNGSGKSNITDSVRWVLGEQKARLLRGTKMEDVIFNGTGKRKAVGLAEVSLIFDNRDKMLGIDFDEVKVTRRAHRSGDNDYLINDAQCRLKDVRELFMDTSIGTEGYSIIGQGRIDSVLSQNDEDRRHIFEEASGIAKFRSRKKESERKLESTELNLMRINDIVNEVEDRYPTLKNDADKAERYLNWENELKGLEIRVLLDSLNKAEQKRQLANTRIDEINQALEKLENDHSFSENEYKSITGELEELRALQDDTNEKIAYKSTLIKEKEGEKSLYRHKLESSEEAARENENFIESSGILREKLHIELEELKLSLENFQGEYEEKQEELKKLTNEKNSYEDKIKIASEDASQKQSMLIEKNTELETKKVRSTNENLRIQGLEARILDVQSRIEKLNESSEDSSGEFEELSRRLDEALQEKENLESDLNEWRAKENQLENSVEDIYKAQRENDSLLHKNEAELDMLTSLEASHEGYDYAVRAVNDYVNSNKSDEGLKGGYRGIVADLLKVPGKYITAVEAALGRQLQNIITTDEKIAKQLIERLKAVKGGRATFLPISTIKSQSRLQLNSKALSMKGIVGIASELIESENEYRNILDYLLGRVIIVESFDVGTQLLKLQEGGYRIVTLEGEIINSSGAITGGYQGKKKSGILARKGRMQELEGENALLRNEIEKLKGDIRKINIDISEIERLKNAAKVKAISLDSEIKSLQNDKLRRDESVKHIKTSLEALYNDKNSLIAEIDGLKIARIHQESEIENIINELKGLESESKESITELKVAQDSLSDIMNRTTELKIDMASSYERLGSKRMSIERQKEKIRELDERENIAVKAIENLDKDREFYGEADQSLSKEIDILTDEKFKLEGEFEARRKELSSLENRRKELYESRGLIDEALNEHRGAVYKQEIVIAKIITEMEGIEASIFEKYEVNIEKARDYVDTLEGIDLSPTAQLKRVKELKELIKSLGSVNINAPEEFKELCERRDFLAEQKGDLVDAKKTLEGILRGLEKEMKKKFIQVFDEININFKEVFSQLFMGGTASIELSDPENVLESGIEIHAQPPGKKLQSLSLLSGGERSLTAIALIFAIMKIKPAPFCILDEIDAALDDVNVNRFARFIEEYAEKSQFIVITHRKGTMESADILYGVTMEEMGISRLLSLKLDQAQRI